MVDPALRNWPEASETPMASVPGSHPLIQSKVRKVMSPNSADGELALVGAWPAP